MEALIVQPTSIPAFPVVVVNAEVALEAATLTTLATEMKVDDSFAQIAADDVKKRCANLIKRIEGERVKAKAPFLDIGKQIDGAAQGVSAKLVAADKVLGTRIWEYQKEQERLRQEELAKAEKIRMEAEAKAKAERDRIEAEAKIKAEAARLAGQPVKPVIAPVIRPVVQAAVYVPPVQKSTSVTTVKRTFLIVDDLDAIPQVVGGVQLWIKTLAEEQIKKLIKAGMTIPGCHVEEKEVPRGM